MVAGHARWNCRSQIGGDVVVLERPSRRRCSQIEKRFGSRRHGENGALRVEIGNGHRFIAEVVEAFPGAIQSVGLHKPTLEDVFVQRDGSRLIEYFWLPVVTLWQRELVRFWRQKSRVLGVVASPLVFWLLIGSGSGDLGAFFFPGALVLTVMFSAIFSTMSIIEDRREGFLLSMLVSPASRTSLVLGKILGSATLAWIQGLIFLAFAPLAGISLSLGEVAPLAGAIFLVSFTLTALGFLIAWRMDSTPGFHAIMNLLLVPMWMVSGSLFPVEGASGEIKIVMLVQSARLVCEHDAVAAVDSAQKRTARNRRPSLVVTVLPDRAAGCVGGAAPPENLEAIRHEIRPICFGVLLGGVAGCRKSRLRYRFPGASPRLPVERGNRPAVRPQVRLPGKCGWPISSTPTCPGPCPRMSSLMPAGAIRVADIPGVKLVSFSVDPEHDTPAALARYAMRYQAEPGPWHFLTGQHAALDELCRNGFELSNVDGGLNHSTRL